MIKVTDVRKRYAGFELDASIEVRPGSITGLVGQNGAGKSTLFKCILGLIRTDGGTVEVFGRDAAALTDADRCRIGAVLADSGFSGYLTISDIRKILKGFYPAFDEAWFARKCQDLGLDEKKSVKELSTGMKAKLKVLCAISHHADLLILDEPTTGLDVIARDEILNMLRDCMEEEPERCILISSHISGDLESLCDDLYMIDKGKIVLHEDTDALLDRYALIKVSEEEYGNLDKSYLLRRKKEPFGYTCLCDQKQFYAENYPGLVIERSGIDGLMHLMIGGEKI